MQRAVAPRLGCAARAAAPRAPAAARLAAAPASRPARGRAGLATRAAAYTVQLTHKGVTHTLSVSEDESILEVALDAGIDVPHDCKARSLPLSVLLPPLQPRVRRAASRAALAADAQERCNAGTRTRSLGLSPRARAPQMGVCMTCPARLIRHAAAPRACSAARRQRWRSGCALARTR